MANSLFIAALIVSAYWIVKDEIHEFIAQVVGPRGWFIILFVAFGAFCLIHGW